MGDIADIAGVVIDGAKILESNVVQSMGQHAHALPKSVVSDPDLVRDWQHGREIGFQHNTSSPLARAGVTSPSVFNVLINWDYAGSMSGLGRFIKDAYAYVQVFSIQATYQYDVKAYFDLPSYTGSAESPVAYLEGRIEVNVGRMITGIEYSYNRHFSISGDGGGQVGARA